MGDKTSVVLAPIRLLGVDKEKLCSDLLRLTGNRETVCYFCGLVPTSLAVSPIVI